MRLMELQLGLALPVHSPVLKLKGFDLNDHEHELNEPVASELWSYSSGTCLESEKWVKKKRSSEEAFGDLPQTTTFPLTLWKGQPNEDDDRKGEKKPYILDKKEEEENHVVGWPPIKSWRVKQLHQRDHDQSRQINNADQTAHHQRNSTGGRGSSNSLYVKVKMKGAAIARKIDLRLYDSYQALTNSLITMFPNGRQNIDKDGRASYALTYQDKDGDWLLAGDVPWQTFTESVQRLEILRNVDG